MLRVCERIRIDPAGKDAVHLVQEGGERIYVKIREIPRLIGDLFEVLETYENNKDCSSGSHGGGVG